jgi:serine-type D-Ala-D-Ala carboxypeptidase/endopeptidase (penicillin-binding protein 4)
MKKLILPLLLLPQLLWANPVTLPSQMSIVVMQAKDGKVLFSQQASTPMTPASTTKLLTSYIALKTLGPDFTFKTQVLQQGDTRYLRFAGDPSLKSSDLQALVTATFMNPGSQATPAQWVIDHSVFSGPSVGRGWAVDDIPWYYAAPVHGVILDQNTINLSLTPPKTLGEPVDIRSKNPELQVVANVIGVDTPTSETLCQLEVNQASVNRVELNGCWPQATPPQTLRLANQFPLDMAKQKLQALLQDQAIPLKGPITTGITPPGVQVLAEHQSEPLPVLIKEILQNSNNIYTDALTKTLGAHAYQRPTFQAGSYFIEKSLKQQLHLPHSELILFDGSGLSTQNLISANTLAQLLRLAYQDTQIKPYFMEALAASGVSGTLKTRFKSLTPPFVGKTGSMSHVSTLAGYHGLETDNPLIYVLMINHEAQRNTKLKEQEESVLRSLIRSYFTNNSASVKL